MPHRVLLDPAMHCGGGGASAPSTPEPITAPGVFRPDWPIPEYAKLPWQRKLKVVEAYTDTLIEAKRSEAAATLEPVIDCLNRYAAGKPLNMTQLNAALLLLARRHTHHDLWGQTMNVDEQSAPTRGGDSNFNPHDASEMVNKLRRLVR